MENTLKVWCKSVASPMFSFMIRPFVNSQTLELPPFLFKAVVFGNLNDLQPGTCRSSGAHHAGLSRLEMPFMPHCPNDNSPVKVGLSWRCWNSMKYCDFLVGLSPWKLGWDYFFWSKSNLSREGLCCYALLTCFNRNYDWLKFKPWFAFAVWIDEPCKEWTWGWSVNQWITLHLKCPVQSQDL